MNLNAIIPVKPLRRGKSRLAGILSEEERTLLNYTMLGNTLRTLTNVPEVSRILVISRDTSALALARDFGARTLQEDGTSDLNTALQRATVVAQMRGALSLLILPADLPLLTPASLKPLIDSSARPPVLAIAPDRRREGTNALLVNPPGLIEYQFGPGSFQRHVEQAQRYPGVRVAICEQPELALDLDLPEDLELLRQLETKEFRI
jgi:2-phospho-L-lactate guanylyltransferase